MDMTAKIWLYGIVLKKYRNVSQIERYQKVQNLKIQISSGIIKKIQTKTITHNPLKKLKTTSSNNNQEVEATKEADIVEAEEVVEIEAIKTTIMTTQSTALAQEEVVTNMRIPTMGMKATMLIIKMEVNITLLKASEVSASRF